MIAELCIDHDHKDLSIRGLLCRNCNTGLGMFNDSLELMQDAINYLKKHKEKINGISRA